MSCAQLYPTLCTWTVARQAPLSLGLSRQEHWSELPFPTPGDLSAPGIEPESPSSALAGGFFTASTTLEAPLYVWTLSVSLRGELYHYHNLNLKYYYHYEFWEKYFMAYLLFIIKRELWESACSAGDLGLIPGLERSSGEGNGNPLQYSGLENSMDRRAWRATVHGFAELDMTEQLVQY